MVDRVTVHLTRLARRQVFTAFAVGAALLALMGCGGSDATCVGASCGGGATGYGGGATGCGGGPGHPADGGSAGDPDAGAFPLGFDSPEGGEIRVEYVRTPGGEFSRGIAFFKSKQNPEATPFPVIAPSADGVCNDLGAMPLWPTAPVDASYFDVGELSIKGGGKTFSFTKQTNYMDFLGRQHGIAYTFEDAASMVSPSTLYDVVLGGSSSAPASVWSNSLGMPAGFQLLPAVLPDAIAIPLGQDFPITWEHPEQTIPQTVLGLVAFLDGNGLLAQLCLTKDVTAGFTVPKTVVAKLPPKGTLVRGQTTHQLRQYPLGRRVDVIGTWCYATPYTTQ